MNADKSSKQAQQEFFIPDLCNIQAVLFLVLVAQLLSIVLELSKNGLVDFSWYSLSLTSLLVQWSFLSGAFCLCALRPTLNHWPKAMAMVACYVLIIAIVMVLSTLGQWVVNGAFNGSGLWAVDTLSLLSNVLICAVLTGIVLRYFYLSEQLRVRQHAELQARIQALQSRIRPHFLFNSMNIIASLIAVDQEAAETAVEDLSSVFRASLAEAGTQVTLGDELELCRGYARIEKLRLDKRLQLHWDVEGVPQTLGIPSLCLQPLLENAIYHGIQQLSEGGTVTITASYQQGVLTITVVNPVASNAKASKQGHQIALANIHERLQAIYGDNAGLVTTLRDGEYRAVIEYPAATIASL
ncbi:MAG: sensor histidine kinase [Spongiibacteraceae bacterium]|nr:sensor histidine kinase [Spongiibacteraceae bacterium]